MSGAAHRMLPLQEQPMRLPLEPRDLDRLFEVADFSRFGGVGGLPGRDYRGQGYTEVPSQWLCEIIVRLKASEEAVRLWSNQPATQSPSFWQGVLDRPVLDGDAPEPGA